MDAVLMSVAALSLAMAIAMAVLVAKMLREERERSDARVAALQAMSAAPPEYTQRTAAISPPSSVARTRRIDDLELRPASPATAHASDLFADRERPSAWGARLVVMGTLACILAVLGFVVFSTSSHRTASMPAATASARPAPADIPPLELMSLRHAQQGQSLTITGLVRNPRTGAQLSRIVATAFIFGPDGAFLASSRAPLDFTTIAPGDESPFVVTVPVTGQVSRYRIGFRAEDGRVIAHVDRRGPEALASTQPR